VVLLATALGLLGCSTDVAPPPLLNVIDVAPNEVDVGDRLDVLGTSLPASEAREATVTFTGELRRPGRAPLVGQVVTVEHAQVGTDRVSMVVTDGIQSRFCGQGDEVAHTTFHGDVMVTLTSTRAGLPVRGVAKGITVGFRAPTPRRAVLEARQAEAARAIDFVGIRVDPISPPAGGVRVSDVRAESLASRAGLQVDDLIVSIDGARVMSPGDLLPNGEGRSVDLGIQRGGEGVTYRRISLDRFHRGVPTDILAAVLVLVIAAGIVTVFMAPTAGIITWVERRVSGRMQARIGPNRAGPQGFFIWVADGIKSLLKEDIIPTASDQLLFRLAPYLVFTGITATFVVMPFGQYLIAADLDIGILFVIAVTSLVTIGLLTGGWASNNKWSLLGGVRSAAQIISYEIPGAIAVACLVMMTGSLRMQDLIGAQGGPGGSVLATGGWPWYWYLFRTPVTFGLFFLYFTTALAEGNRAPFDLPEAESELVAGYSTEYSGMRYLFFFFGEWANVFVMSGIASALFLGGWQIPGISPSQQEAHFALQLLGAFIFLLKSWILVFVVIWIRWTLPRIRIDQMMSLCWKYFVPLAFGAFLLTGLWMLIPVPAPVELALSIGTCGLFGLLLVHFVRRVAYNTRESRFPVHLNPFL
jgi:NADH-quinone oxidoreductase subunit H